MNAKQRKGLAVLIVGLLFSAGLLFSLLYSFYRHPPKKVVVTVVKKDTIVIPVPVLASTAQTKPDSLLKKWHQLRTIP